MSTKSREVICRSCRKWRYAPSLRMIKPTQDKQITSYKGVHPDDPSASSGKYKW